MNFLEERIVKDGIVKEGNVLKVDSFLNHQMDVELLDRMGKEFYERFKDKPINKILTIEASGIAIACFAAKHFAFAMLSLVCCQLGFLLVRNYRFIEKYKYIFYFLWIIFQDKVLVQAFFHDLA